MEMAKAGVALMLLAHPLLTLLLALVLLWLAVKTGQVLNAMDKEAAQWAREREEHRAARRLRSR